MKVKLLLFAAILSCGISFTSCNKADEDLNAIAFDLCQYIPDHVLLERSKDYMTEDFYAVLDTMFNLPEHEAMDHEWLHYFVTGNGGTIADYTVDTVEVKDKTHAIAILSVRPKWEDGSFCEEDDIEEHRLYMEKVGGKWLISDFDEHKQDCINGIANWRKEEALRQAISNYLVKEIGSQYSQGDLCVPVLMIVSAEEEGSEQARVWGDFWVFNYNIVGDTLKTVSGGNHSGYMDIAKAGEELQVKHPDVSGVEPATNIMVDILVLDNLSRRIHVPILCLLDLEPKELLQLLIPLQLPLDKNVAENSRRSMNLHRNMDNVIWRKLLNVLGEHSCGIMESELPIEKPVELLQPSHPLLPVRL